MTVHLWTPDAPARCACAGAYRPQLTDKGKLVKSREPAWRMMEQTRDPGCLQEQFRALAAFYRLEYQHHGDSRKSGAGYPDVHLWADGRGSAYVELKRMRHDERDGRDDPTEAQVRRMASLQRAPHRVYLARPCCLLVGAVDEMMAEFAGVPCRYVKGHPDGPARSFADLLAEPTAPAAAAPAVASPVARRPPAVILPGIDPPEPFPDALGLVVPMPGDEPASSAVRDLETWLRGAGFPAVAVPFPMRLVVGAGVVMVQVRSGQVRIGGGVLHARVWRGGVPAQPFPSHLVDALRARTIEAESSEKVVELIEDVEPASTLPPEVA